MKKWIFIVEITDRWRMNEMEKKKEQVKIMKIIKVKERIIENEKRFVQNKYQEKNLSKKIKKKVTQSEVEKKENKRSER